MASAHNYTDYGSPADQYTAYNPGLIAHLDALPLYNSCWENVLSKPIPTYATPHCLRTFDGWMCWNDTEPGKIAISTCPHFITGFDESSLSHRECTENGTWYRHPLTNKEWTNYTTCMDYSQIAFRDTIVILYTTGFAVSLVALILSLAIFLYFKSLRCTRIYIHKNLFVSFVVNNIAWIAWYQLSSAYAEENPWWCICLHIVIHYFLTCNYFWMFCEGLYLHTILVIAFVDEEHIMKWLYLIGWGLPLILMSIYTAIRGSYEVDSIEVQRCWTTETYLEYIHTGPVVVSQIINAIFLINIVRVLVTKLRAVHSPDGNQTRKAVRATIILIPLLGLHYFVNFMRPSYRSSFENLHAIVMAIVTSFQGLWVAFLFCFFNGEVLGIFKKKWTQLKEVRNPGQQSYACGTTLSVRQVRTEHIYTH